MISGIENGRVSVRERERVEEYDRDRRVYQIKRERGVKILERRREREGKKERERG